MSIVKQKCRCRWAVNPRAQVAFRVADLTPVKLGYDPGQWGGADLDNSSSGGDQGSPQGPSWKEEAVDDLDLDLGFPTTSVKLEVPSPPAAGKNEAGDESDDNFDANAEWYVEKILDKKIEGGVAYYQIKWMGWPDSKNTWEPLEHLTNSMEFVAEYDKQHKGQQKRMNGGASRGRGGRGRGRPRGSGRGGMTKWRGVNQISK